MKKIFISAAMLTVYAFASSNQLCTINSNCPNRNEICLSGTCQERSAEFLGKVNTSCETNDDCKAAGLFCDANKQCKPSPPITAVTGCKTSSSCPTGRVCRRDACVAPSLVESMMLQQAKCQTAADCNKAGRSGYKCQRGQCVKDSLITIEDEVIVGECAQDFQCQNPDLKCIRGTCQRTTEDISNAERFKGLMCMEDYQCGDPNLICVRGACSYRRFGQENIHLEQAGCKSKSDCKNGQDCKRGKCCAPSMIVSPYEDFEALPVPCTQPSDCNSGERCFQGLCNKPKFAPVSAGGIVCGKATCKVGQKCIRGACAAPSLELIQ